LIHPKTRLLDAKIPVFVFLGPTAVGKTAFLFDLFGGSGVGASVEIVSADSMQVYRGMDIGTAKPDSAERAVIPHHLIDLRNPDEQFSAGEFVRLADECCAAIYARGKLPVVAGGSGFYLKNFIQGLPEAPPSSSSQSDGETIRQRLRRELETGGVTTLYAELQENDPAAAARIHVNDTYRIIRALEVLRLTGKPLSAFEVENAAQKRERSEKYDFLIISLARKREELYARINSRVDMMFVKGLYEEVRALFQNNYTPNDPGMKAIGYREFFVSSEDGGDSGDSGGTDGGPDAGPTPPHRHDRYALTSDIEGARALVKQNSRHYAKRQETFFKGIGHTHRFMIGQDSAKADGEGTTDKASGEYREAEAKEAIGALVQAFWRKYHA
jgi:tRNA dimethylallyltransferase